MICGDEETVTEKILDLETAGIFDTLTYVGIDWQDIFCKKYGVVRL